MTMLKQHLFRYQGHIGAYLVVAGVDPTGVGLFTVHAHGSTDKLPYVTLGSGSLAAMSVFESMWKPNLDREGAINLSAEAIKAGIFNDLGSGSNVDVCVIENDKPTQMLRNFMKPNERGQKERNYRFPKGTTAYLNQKVISKEEMRKHVTIEEVSGDQNLGEVEKMEVDT
jgi:20S proteasome subunit beta 2